MKIVPLHDRVVVRRLDEETTSPGGIVIPDTAAEKPVRGEIIAVGPGKTLDSGQVQKLAVKEGDSVLFGKYAGTEIKIDSQDYVVMREDDLLAIIEK
ncbi:MAG: co-chaperone GroES [Candidatus Porifericomitaceae bacterium WSBS_2022_MAG_OTU9]